MAISLISRLKRSHLARFIVWASVLNFIDLLAILLPSDPSVKQKKRVVFVKMDGIGDYVIWTANFGTLRKLYPSARYERILVGSDKWVSMAENETTFDRKVFVNSERFIASPAYRLRILREVRGIRADVVVSPRSTRDFLWSDAMVRCSGAPIRIGSSGLDNLMTRLQERISDRWYTKLVEAPLPEEHELASNLTFLMAIDPTLPQELIAPHAPDLMRSAEIDLPGDYAVLFLSAFSPHRRWPTANFAETAGFLAQEFGYHVVVCGGPNDANLAERFGERFGGEFVNMIGKTTLPELSELITGAKIVVTNDTGASHIAIAARCPTIIITPGNQVGRYYPYPAQLEEQGIRHIPVFHEMPCFGCGYNCIYTDLPANAPKPCVADVSVGDVIAAITKLLDDRSPVSGG